MTKIDLSYLESIAGGDKGFIKEMLEMFSKTIYPEIKNIELFQSEKNWEMLGKTAHKIKAPVQILGQIETYDMILAIEKIAKNETNHENVDELIAKLKINMLAINIELKKIIEVM